MLNVLFLIPSNRAMHPLLLREEQETISPTLDVSLDRSKSCCVAVVREGLSSSLAVPSSMALAAAAFLVAFCFRRHSAFGVGGRPT